MADVRLGIIVNGATGRMTRNQHLRLALCAIAKEGGLALADGRRLLPEPLLVGRNAGKVGAVAAELGVTRWTTDLDSALADPAFTVYFDGVTTALRAANLAKAIDAGKHVYCEKPTAERFETALALAQRAERALVRHGVVQDKLWAPGIAKLGKLVRSGFFGRILAVRIEGCYWVFEGDLHALQRPSWNYRKAEGGGMILDMMPHYRYLLEDLIAPVKRIVCHAANHIQRRWDERGQPYEADADDACYAIAELERGIVAQITSSWCTRVRRDDIVQMQVDGTLGSAVAGLRHCWIQPHLATPRAQWSLDSAAPIDFLADWQRLPDTEPYVNAFRAEWELFLRHVVDGAPFRWTLREGARSVQLAELAARSAVEGRWVDVPAAAG
jgi:predicted dehydrogenase